jgi:hypothetical protein
LRAFYEGSTIKARKLGRERPKLYRGKFKVPSQVAVRLATAKAHLILAEGTALNIKVDLLYLAIDNVLSAAIIAKESSLTTTSHKKKITKFFKHFSIRAKARALEKADFERFYELWLKSRYQLFGPSWQEVMDMDRFASHVYDVGVTEIARSFRSDETILAREVEKLVHVYKSDRLHEVAERIHEEHEQAAEEAGEMYGGKLARKFLNPWNYMRMSLVSDRKGIRDIVDESNEFDKPLRNLLDSWDIIVNKSTVNNLVRLAYDIAACKMKKRRVDEKEARRQALEAARNHPELLKFRLMLSLVFDSSEPRETLGMWGRAISSTMREITEQPRRMALDAWETWKEYKKRERTT